MKLYHLPLKGNDGKVYGIRALQTEQEIAQLQRVGIMGEAFEIQSIEDVSDEAVRDLLAVHDIYKVAKNG